MAVAGIDYSTRFVDVVLLDEDTDAAVWHRYELAGADAFDRARSVAGAVPGPSTAIWEDVVAVGIEEPRGPGNGALLRVQGAILGRLPRSVLVQPLVPSSWRKACGLPGNATKDAVSWFVYGRDRTHVPDTKRGECWCTWPQDACDAYAIAYATRSLIHKEAAA